ncbi:MAG: carboxypeptidase-like regulatory domain-containing protein [Saprospiraceae bacterium]|nr:carboxypeptidase-like regulatory domain-containing protein [Saprospiraceae bacterium]
MHVQFLVFLFLQLPLANSQVKGIVRGQNGEALSFASIYLKSGSTGTTSNLDGNFELYLPAGKHQLVFQYTGYQKAVKELNYDGTAVWIEMDLVPLVYELKEVEFIASREDPAYAIMRAAIKNRKKYEYHSRPYQCKSYSKGMFKIVDAPDKIFGTSLGNMNGHLDSNRQGILYLSEAVTQIYFQPPDIFHEKMLASKVAGSDNGFSINWASAISLNLYNNFSSFGKAVISPVADFAMSHYKYRLEGSFKDTDSSDYFKIKITPRFEYDATWQGYIYITDKEFSIYGFDGFVLGKQIKQELFDTIFLRQEFIPLPSEKVRKIQTQHYKVSGKFLGIKVLGSFSLSFSDYAFGDSDIKVNRSEIFEVLDGANVQKQEFWDSVRTIPLTSEELVNYHFKDSIKLYKSTDQYKDSIDRIRNRIKPIHILTGYRYVLSKKRFNISTNGLLDWISFNPVQGMVLDPEIDFVNYLKKYFNYQRIGLTLKPNYGFGEDRFRVSAHVYYQYNNVRKSVFQISGGSQTSEFHNREGVEGLYNTFSSLYLKVNYLKLFDQKFVHLYYGTDLNYTHRIQLNAGFYQRQNLGNHTDYHWSKRDQGYLPNHAINFQDSVLWLDHKSVLKAGVVWRIQPGMKVWKTPDGVEKIGSEWPFFEFNYQNLYYPHQNLYVGIFGLNSSYTTSPSRFGELTFYTYGKWRFGKNPPDVPDRFYSNSIPFGFYQISENPNSTLGLRPYDIIASQYLLEGGIDWNFKGLALDRIPFINRLGLEELVRLHSVIYDQATVYTEISFGLGNIGYKIFRIFRVDFVKTFGSSSQSLNYFKVGMSKTFSAG